MKQLQVKILRGTIGDGMVLEAGQIANLEERTARYLVEIGKARFVREQDAIKSITKLAGKHHGATVAILGGGPSLPGDLKKLPKDAVLIAVNHHAQKLIDCPYMVFCDSPAQSEFLREGIKSYSGIKISKHVDFADAALDLPHYDAGFSSATALWVADYLGAASILLCGMDCYSTGENYFHQDEPHAYKGHNTGANTRAWAKASEQIGCRDKVRSVSGPLVEVFGSYVVPKKKSVKKSSTR